LWVGFGEVADHQGTSRQAGLVVLAPFGGYAFGAVLGARARSSGHHRPLSAPL